MSTATPDIVAKALRDLARERDLLRADETEAAAQAAIREVRTRESSIDGRMSQIQQAQFAIKALDAKIGDESTWREHLCVARPVLVEELRALPSRIRDPKLLALQNNVTRSLLSLDHGLVGDRFWLTGSRLGQLLADLGYTPAPLTPNSNQVVGEFPWFGSLKEIDKRLVKLRTDRAEAQSRLDAAMMSDADRASKLAETMAKNAAPRKKTRGDGSTYLKHADGTIEELDDVVTTTTT